MKAIALIALNFLRQRRWPVLLYYGWIALSAMAAGDFGRSRPVTADVAFYAQQQAISICVFSMFLAADGIDGERKSRRILLLLSKSISRAEYLLAIILGAWVLAVSYAVAGAVFGNWLAARAMLPSAPLLPLFIVIIAGALIFAAVAVFCATFLNPYFAMFCTLVLFAAPLPFHYYRHPWAVWWPGFPILVQFLKFNFHSEWAPEWMAVIATLLESVTFWGLAVAVFGRRDIAVPVE